MDSAIDKVKAQAEKQKGNDAFGNKQWAEAIGFYSAARLADPTEPTIPLNRAMAYLKLAKFVDAERDCTAALALSPNNVKALYRRATARMGADQFDAARHDYQHVLRLDAGNAEAKAGLVKADEALERTKLRRPEPLELPRLTARSTGSTRPDSDADLATTGTARSDSNSSVEAARKFLQKVGMSDTPEVQTATSGSANGSANGSRSVPPKFPGETGGLLREVTTRRTTTASHPKNETHRAPSASTASTAPRASSTASQKTASALNFGAGPSRGASQSIPPPTPTKPNATPSRLSAIEFQRRWKSKSDRLQLLASLDIESIPGMIDAMLEPELVAEVLESLANGHRSSPHDDKLEQTIADVLTVMPRCKRFRMTVAMLDAQEKANASYLIDAVGRADLKSIWEVA